MTFEITVPEGNAHATSRLRRINPILATDVVAEALNKHLAAGLIQHSTSPFSTPPAVITMESGGISITVHYETLNKICLLYTSPSPRDKRQSRMPSSA